MTQNCCRLSSKVALAKSIVTSALTRSRENRREINITPELILRLQWVQLKSNMLNIIRVVVQAAVIFPMVGLEFWCDFLSLFDKMFWLVVGCVTSCLAVKTQPSPTPVYWRLVHRCTLTLTLTLGSSWQGVSPVHSSSLLGSNSGEDVNTKISYCDWLQLIFIPAERRWGRYQSDSLYFICCCQTATSKIKKNHNKFVTRQDRESSDSTSIYWRGSLDRVLEFFKSNFHFDIPLVTWWLSCSLCAGSQMLIAKHCSSTLGNTNTL